MAKIKINMLDTDSLKPHPRNSKKHPAEQVQKIARSIKNYGFNSPIIIDNTNTILAGHGRWQAALLMNLEEVPVVKLEHLSKDEARAFLIADNKTAESGYKEDLMAEELFELSRLGFDGQDLGFSEKEMQKMINFTNSNEPDTIEDELDGIDNAECPSVQTGDIWNIGEHKLIVVGRRIHLDKIYDMLTEAKQPTHIFLDDRQSSSFLAIANKAGEEITKQLEVF